MKITVTGRANTRLRPELTFENFVHGKANQIAWSAALQVVERPGTAYNPLFLYGGVGLGKTHLIHAVGNAFLERNPRSKVRYIHADVRGRTQYCYRKRWSNWWWLRRTS